MPKKGYKQSPEHLEKNRLARLNHRPSEETRQKMRDAKLGNKNHNYGKTFSQETCDKISAATMGRGKGVPRPEHVKKAIGDAHRGERSHTYGKPLPEDVKEKIRIATSGEKNHNWGKKFSDETRNKLSEKHTGKIIPPEVITKMSNAQKGEKGNNFRKALSLETRNKISEKMSGENHPFWNGGTSFAPYCQKFNRSFKERVRLFFKRTCVECGKVEEGKRLHVHHVNFNKMTCCDNTDPLFVALCHSCHNKTQFDREYWIEHFTTIIKEKYCGKCYFTKEEILNLKGIGT
jgi:hypothetical protein